MPRKKLDEGFEDLSDELEEAPNEANMESALQPRDYSSRKILALVTEKAQILGVTQVLTSLLTGAQIRVVDRLDLAVRATLDEDWDTYVVDLQEIGVSESDFVKLVNNQLDAMLVALPYPVLTQGEEVNRFKLEPLRKLFDTEKPAKPRA